MTTAEVRILRALVAHGELSGRELVDHGAANYISVYTVLSHMGDDGLVKGRNGAKRSARYGPPLPLFRATEAGRRAVAALDVDEAEGSFHGKQARLARGDGVSG